MEEFKSAYKNLNDDQKQAVDTIYGPVMVIAGPGTGKTQLLAIRTANILKMDPTVLPSNILCLTFTDSASNNLRDRLIKYIGQDAFKVGVFTFHAFGSYIMGVYPEYFYGLRQSKTADELSSYQLIEQALDDLPPDSDLVKKGIDNSYLSIRFVKNFINDCKNANLDPEQVKKILDKNQSDLNELTPMFKKSWPLSLSVKNINQVYQLVQGLSDLDSEASVVEAILPLKNSVALTLSKAVKESTELPGRSATKPLTAWKNNWLVKTTDGWEFKAQAQNNKLKEVLVVYENYQKLLKEKGMVDFSDQINWTLDVLKNEPELALNLKEQFQFIMIDEFQDTNRSQLLLARYLANELANETNILVVGDDDQAIYRFQGADIGNIGEFEHLFPGYQTIKLGVNYRSSKSILDPAQQINSQISFSLQNLKSINKNLTSTVKQKGKGLELFEYDYDTAQNSDIANKIRQLIDLGHTDTAVLARERSQLDELVPYLRHLNIPIDYERRENVLEQEHIRALVEMARLVNSLSSQDYSGANELMPRIISEPMWQVEPAEIWKISQVAYKNKTFWLDAIYELDSPKTKNIADFFVRLANRAKSLPVESVLDELIGASTHKNEDDYEDTAQKKSKSTKIFSPFKDYFFSSSTLNTEPEIYLRFLSHLSTLRSNLRSYQDSQAKTLYLSDLISYFDAYQRAGLRMVDKSPHNETSDSVKLMTVHKAKGLEFENVFVIGLTHQSWSKNAGNSRFAYPENLNQIKPSDNQDDDGLRLLFVAMTRAKQNLTLSYFKNDEFAKSFQPYAPLLSIGSPKQPKIKHQPAIVSEQYEQRWLSTHASYDKTQLKSLLKDSLDSYKLSATHLNNFTDVTQGGPIYFLTQNLLHFPSAMSPSAVYGSVIHSILNEVHAMVIKSQKIDTDKLKKSFESKLDQQPLSANDKSRYLKQGIAVIDGYITQKANWFKPAQKTEFDFKDQGVLVGPARLKGLIDVIEFDKSTKSCIVYDYKTGSALSAWEQPASAKEYNRIKSHRYRQQLLFYKLLMDNSSEFGAKGVRAESGCLIFVEPDSYGKIRELSLSFNNEELERTKKLILSVWDKIMNLDFNDTQNYPKTAEGIIQFENDLINN